MALGDEILDLMAATVPFARVELAAELAAVTIIEVAHRLAARPDLRAALLEIISADFPRHLREVLNIAREGTALVLSGGRGSEGPRPFQNQEGRRSRKSPPPF